MFFSFNKYDRGIVFGLSGAVLLFLMASLWGGTLTRFFNPLGLLIVVGGTLAAGFVHFSIIELKEAYKGFRRVLISQEQESPLGTIKYFSFLARRVKEQGLVSLDEEARHTEDEFLRLGFQLASDGQRPEQIKHILETQLHSYIETKRISVEVFERLGNYAPAMGLIGTLIGLVHMLSYISEPNMIGPAMSVAILTTLYGAILANLVLLPIAGKLRSQLSQEILLFQLGIEGILSLSREENPLVLEQRLGTFLPVAVGA